MKYRLLTVAAASCAALASTTSGANTVFQPNLTAGASQCRIWGCETANGSFMSDLKHHRSSTPLRDELFDPQMAVEMKRDYEKRVRDYEFRSRHDQLTVEQEKKYQEDMQGFGKEIIRNVKNYHIRAEVKELRIRLENNPDIARFKVPLGITIGLIGFASGEPARWRLTEKTELKVQTLALEKQGKVDLQSPWVNGHFRYKQNPKSTDWQSQDFEEKYAVALSRPLPWSLSSGVSYGGTSKMLTASLTKHLSQNLSCGLAHTSPLEPSPRPSEGVARVDYSMNF